MKPPDESLVSVLPPGGAASITVSVLDEITKRITPRMIAVGIEQLLNAKLSNGQPDVRAIESGIKLYLNYTVGLPVQRQEIITKKLTGPTMDQLLSTQAGIDTLRRLLAKADAKASETAPIKGDAK
jgi:hypothetical protein